MATEATATGRVGIAPATAARGLAALRIFVGIVWLANGLAKLTGKATYDLGVVSFGLIGRDTAKSLLVTYSGDQSHALGLLKSFYGDFVVPNWGFFQWLLTAAELTAGICLVFGVASRFGALVAVALIGPLWVMNFDNSRYLFEWPLDVVPLIVLAIVPAGRAWGRDARLAARFGSPRLGRWPF
jgi:uncharacterized membrane protein YphA (DoxX/SURF4 family)